MSNPLDRRVVLGAGMVIIAAAAAFGLATANGAHPAGTASPSPTLAANVSPSPSTSSSPTASAAPSASPSPTPTPMPTPTMVADPLTGRLVTEAVAARHPIAVMIDDLSAARPQSGLSSASIVWQAPAEGGIPRYMAIFHDVIPGAVGPVRSSRYYFIAWAAEWKAVYAHAGGSPQAMETLRQKGNGQLVYNADEFRWGSYFHRISTRFAPHNLYTDGKTLRRLAAKVGATDAPMKAAWAFGPDAPLEARPVGGKIVLSYPANSVVYRYDRASNTYLRTVSGEAQQTDAADKVRIAPKNVVIMRMVFGPLDDGHPNKHRLEAQVIGSGTAWIATNGRTIKGTWKKTSLTSPTRFYDSTGKVVRLTIGQTFVQVMRVGYGMSIADGKLPAPGPSPLSPSPSPAS